MIKTRRVENLPIAEFDIQEAYNWYESKQIGLGDEFIDELQKFRQSLRTFPFKHRVVKNEIRLGVLERFPYLVYFEVFDDVVMILAVVYGGRHPEYWKDRRLPE